MNRVAFRVDASSLIGSGNLMRCLTLARLMYAEGAEIHFISRGLSDLYQNLLSKENFALHSLPENTAAFTSSNALKHAHWLGTTWEVDAAQTKEIINQLAPIDILIVDHYAIDAKWEQLLRAQVQKIIVMDDLADRDHGCDMLIDPNFYFDQETRYQQHVSKQTHCLLGPRFVLLRPEFFNARNAFPRTNHLPNEVKRINVCFGGIDPHNDTLRTLKALLPWLTAGEIEVDVILGAAAKHYQEVAEWIATYPKITLHVNPTNVAELLARADAGIGAAGTMLWERACVGLPSLSLAVADNQKQLAEDTARIGLHLYAGESTKITIKQLRTAIGLLFSNSYLRRHLAETCLKIIDGKGAKRVLKQICDPTITFRKATLSDCENLFTWRNDPITRRFSHNQSEISYPQHQQWFTKIVDANNHVLLIGSDHKGPAGIVRFDNQESKWIISVYLVPSRHGEGLGTPLLKQAIAWLKHYAKKDLIIEAQIHQENVASQLAFQQAGFKKKYSIYIAEVYGQ